MRWTDTENASHKQRIAITCNENRGTKENSMSNIPGSLNRSFEQRGWVRWFLLIVSLERQVVLHLSWNKGVLVLSKIEVSKRTWSSLSTGAYCRPIIFKMAMSILQPYAGRLKIRKSGTLHWPDLMDRVKAVLLKLFWPRMKRSSKRRDDWKDGFFDTKLSENLLSRFRWQLLKKGILYRKIRKK